MKKEALYEFLWRMIAWTFIMLFIYWIVPDSLAVKLNITGLMAGGVVWNLYRVNKIYGKAK